MNSVISIPTIINSKSEILEYCKAVREMINEIENKEKQRLAIESSKSKEINDLYTVASKNPYISLREAAAIFNVSKSKIYSLVTSGNLPSKRFGKIIRISTIELIEWLKNENNNL